MSLREMFRAMQQGRGWLTDAEVSSRIVELQLGATPDWDGELVELLRVMESRMEWTEAERYDVVNRIAVTVRNLHYHEVA